MNVRNFWMIGFLFFPVVLTATDPNTVIGIVTDANPATFNEPSNAVLSPNEQTLYIPNFEGSTVSIVDVATNRVTGIVTDPESTISNPYGISITPNGLTAYVINTSDTISIIDTQTNTVTGLVNTAAAGLSDPFYMAITADGTTGYVVNGNSANVTVVDLTTNATTQSIVCQILTAPTF